MEKFRDLLEMNEASDMSIEDFMKSVESNFHKHFPNGFINMKHGNNLTESISGSFGMIGNIKDNNGGYHDNDKMRHAFIMFPVTADKTLWSFKTSIGGIYTNPEEGSFNAMGSIKTKMGNNSKLTLAKADVKMLKFFKKLSALMKENINNIFGVDKIDKKYLTFK